MKIFLPNSTFLGNIDAFLRQIDLSNPSKLEITGNKSWISVHPVVLSMVAALCLTVDKDKILYEPFEAKSKHYFERMRLFSILDVQSGMRITEHEPAGRFIPLTIIKDSEELSTFIRDMVPLLHLEPVQVEPIKYVVSELVRNVFEHSESAHGAVLCAQYYPDINKIRIGIANPERDAHSEKSDLPHWQGTVVGVDITLDKNNDFTNLLELIRQAYFEGIQERKKISRKQAKFI